MKLTKKALLIIAVVLAGLAVGVFFFRRRPVRDIGTEPGTRDPYATYRQEQGSWNEEEFDSQGYWTIVPRYYPEPPAREIVDTVKAFLKGHNISGSSVWMWETVLRQDFDKWYQVRGNVSPLRVAVGEYVTQ